MSKTYTGTAANNQNPEEQAIRPPLPLYQSTHTPPSAIDCHSAGGCKATYCRAPVQPCPYGEPFGEGSRANAVPLALLDRWPALVEGPACKGVVPTTTEHVVGKGTHRMAVMLFFTTAVGVFMPYSAKPFKNVRHDCMRCVRTLATNRFGGGTMAHMM